MKFNKHYFVQFKDVIENERSRFDAHYEEAQTSKTRCTHSNTRVIDNELRCSCGAAWSGAGLERLARHLQTSP